jgi:integrase
MPLSDIAIRNAKPGETDIRLFDGGGMFLLITPKGAKWWRFKYRFDGKNKLLSFGVYPEVSLKQAREERDKARELLRQGTDPSAARKRAKQSQQASLESSFEFIAREWIGQQSGRWTPDHAERVLVSLEQDAFPTLGARPVNEIEAPELLDMVRAIERRGALETAGRVMQRCAAVFRYAVHTGRTKHNPAGDLRGALKTRKVEHRAALSRAELPELLRKIEAYDGRLLTRLALRFTALTFVRPGELRGARWDEFDIEAAEWRIPAERMKMKAPHLVPLSAQALATLEEIRPLTGHSDFVFPSERSLSKPMSENTLLYALYRLGYRSRMTAHGFRAVASTILNESGFTPDVIERQLAHVEQNKVRAAYHRSEYLDERQRMMQWWADYLDGARDGAEVIPFRRTR